MKKNVLLTVICSAALAGCDYSVSLTDTPEQPIDRAIIGSWVHTSEQGKEERLLILPLSRTEYLVSFPAGGKDAMFARACFCQAVGRTLVQLKWFGTARGTMADSGSLYQYAIYKQTGNKLEFRLLNADVVDRNITSREAFLAALKAAKDRPDLFCEPVTFTFEPTNKPAEPQAGEMPKRPPIPAAWR